MVNKRPRRASRTASTTEVPVATSSAQLASDRPVTSSPSVPPLPPQVLDRLLARVTTVGDRDPIEVTAPFTEEVLGSVPSCTAEDVAEAVRRARSAQRAWARTPVRTRAEVLRRYHDLVLERQEEALDLIQLEAGKVRAHAFEEVADAAIVAAYYARTGPGHLAPRRREGALPGLTRTRELRHPKGVVGFIAPWNYPLSMAITDVLPALLAGNGAVLKPAQTTPFTALWAVDMAYEAGLPEGLLQVVTGRGSVLGTPMIDAVDFITFTGSTEVGRSVGEQAGRRLIGCSLELGGKNAMLVLDDADVDDAVQGAVAGCFASAGQLCISIERLFVAEAIADEFTARFVAAVEDLVLSASLAYGGELGSLASRSQLETVEQHVDDARAKGATILTGGRRRLDVGPLFYAPTVLADVTEDMRLFADETFGPVVTISRFTDVDDAVERANDSPYGLNASVWTGDTRRGREVAARLEVGTVNVNEAYAAAWASVDAPMGGFKDSGLGRRHGREGITKYTEVQTVAVQRFVPVSRIPGLSQDRNARTLTAALKLMHAIPGLRRA
ncbi:MAG: succinate-semialdehyde dehydrogenase (NADP(+)) [Actinobacteria bacterium]|nr:succinate-semialdehyde dehydrogenase (NADP(+)) [Actinomycetota bacterium]